MSLSAPRRLAGFSPVHLLVLVAVAELSIFRLAVPALRPKANEPIPVWFEALENIGLFLLYFGTTLAIGVLAVRAWEAFQTRKRGVVTLLELVLGGAFVACALLGFASVAVSPSSGLSFAFHSAWAFALVALIVLALVRHDDWGVAIGMAAVAVPLLLHYVHVFIGYAILSEDQLDSGSLIERAHDWGLLALVFAALVTPYVFCPKPAIRAVTQIVPFVIALLIGGIGAVLVRSEPKAALDLASLGVGVDLMPGVSNNDMALYLLALATLSWTLTATTTAESESRREVGIGLGLIVLGGYGFSWPLHFLLPVVGMLVMLDAAPHLRDEETPLAVRPRTPPIDDDAWTAWVMQLAAALRGDEDQEIRTVTVRGEAESSQTVMVGERHGVTFKARFGRLHRALVVVDVVAGREVDESVRATFTLFAKVDALGDVHPAPPPAAPSVTIDDPAFMERFRVRGDAAAVNALLDEELRARATTMLEGWLAWWQGASARFRVYPAVGAQMDHPVPLGELAARGAGTVERMTAVIDLVTTIASRGLGAPAQPSLLE